MWVLRKIDAHSAFGELYAKDCCSGHTTPFRGDAKEFKTRAEAIDYRRVNILKGYKPVRSYRETLAELMDKGRTINMSDIDKLAQTMSLALGLSDFDSEMGPLRSAIVAMARTMNDPNDVDEAVKLLGWEQ